MQTDQERTNFEFGFASDVGRKRKGADNQDTLGIILPHPDEDWHPPLLIVADGLGGYQGGSTASQLVVQTFEEVFKSTKHPADYSGLLTMCTQRAHAAIRAQGSSQSNLSNMGTTVVAVVLEQDHIYVLNVGDSRAYIVRGRRLLQISQDQSWVASQVQAGILTPQEATRHPYRNRLEMAVTANREQVRPNFYEMPLEKNDIIILCSDGLWGVVPESLIWAALSELSPQVAANRLVDLANRSGGPDNISIIVARQVGAVRVSSDPNLDDTNP